MSHSVVQRIENALWGAFIGNALAMPVHCSIPWSLPVNGFREA